MKRDVNLDSATVTRLRAMWKNVDYWMKAANGKIEFYRSTRDRILARDIAISCLRDYSDMLDRAVEKNFPKIARDPKEPA